MKKYVFKLSEILKEEFFVPTPRYNIFCNPPCENCGKNSASNICAFSEEKYWHRKRLPLDFPLFDFAYKENNIYFIGDCKRCYPDRTDDKFVSNLHKLQQRINRYKAKHSCEFIVVTATPKTIENYDAKDKIKKMIISLQAVIPIKFNEITLKLCSEYMC